MSQNETFKKFVMKFPLSKKMSRRFVVGEELYEAIEAIVRLNENGITATLDHLGENVKDEKDARASAAAYLEILEEIKRSDIDSHVSLKLTQMGLDVGEEVCFRNVEEIVRLAEKYSNFVRIDMEGSPYTQKTMDIFYRLRRNHKNVGIVIQSCLYRSQGDIERIIENGYSVRLCKGAYRENEDIAFPKKKDVDANYIKLTEMLLSEKAHRNGVYPAIATHDEKIINWVRGVAAKNNIEKDTFEFQMLNGIRRDLQRELVEEEYRVRIYVPYGDQWYPYFMRRLAERPANLIFLIKNILID
jgi:proline dehydrogenase